MPPPQASTSNGIDLVFVSDTVHNYKGFDLYYEPGKNYYSDVLY